MTAAEERMAEMFRSATEIFLHLSASRAAGESDEKIASEAAHAAVSIWRSLEKELT